MNKPREEAINRLNFANDYLHQLRNNGKGSEEIREENKDLINEVHKLEKQFGYRAFSGLNIEYSSTSENYDTSEIGKWR